MSKIDRYALVIDEEGCPLGNAIPMKSNEKVVISNTRDLTPAQKRIINQKDDMKLFNDDNGGFVTMYYVKNELLFNKLELDLASVSRVIYLATYLDYDGTLVMNGGASSGKAKEPMTRKNMQYVLGLSEATFNRFLKDVKDNNLLTEENSLYKLNIEYFNKGKVDKKKSFTRIYVDTVRELYEGCKTSQHKTLAYVFRLIPKVHYDTNTICNNPSDETPEHMTFKETAEFVGIDISTKQNINKFKKSLYSLSFEKNGQRHYLFKGIIVEGKDGNKDYFAVNPYIYYGGSNYEEVKNLIGKLFFKQTNALDYRSAFLYL